MNFLSLCKRLRQEAGYSGSGPASVTGQTGEAKRVVDWINDAWLDIQVMRGDWRFMLEPFLVTLNSGDSQVTLSTNYKSMLKKTVIVKRANGALSFPGLLTEEEMRALKRENTETPSYPRYVSVDSAGLMTVFPSCNETVTIAGDYYVKPSEMSENTDIPRLPEEYHLAIVWKALMSAGGFDEAGNTWQRGNNKFTQMLNAINGTQLPGIKLGGPLA